MRFSNMKVFLLYLAPLSLASYSTAYVGSPIPRRDQPSTTQTSFLCLPPEVEAATALSQNSPNRTTCDCATLEAPDIIVPTVQPNVTDFADPQQCSDYVLVSARGTGEAPGWSSAVHGMTLRTLRQVPNGAYYPVRYPAAFDQNTTQGSRDIIDSISQGLGACPNRTYVLYGVSQGVAVVLKALPEFTDEMFNSVKAVVLVGNPFRAPGKRSNVDGKGRRTSETKKATGFGYGTPDAPELSEKWDRSGKVIDICIDSDGFCNSRKPCNGLTMGHMVYGFSDNVQTVGTNHAVNRLLGNE